MQRLILEFIKRMGRKPNAVEMLKLRFKASSMKEGQLLKPDFSKGDPKRWINQGIPKKKKIPETEAELKIRMELENKEAVARIRKKKANPFKDVEATGKIDPNWDPDSTGMASGGIARVGF